MGWKRDLYVSGTQIANVRFWPIVLKNPGKSSLDEVTVQESCMA
jgi:hypothetical protein